MRRRPGEGARGGRSRQWLCARGSLPHRALEPTTAADSSLLSPLLEASCAPLPALPACPFHLLLWAAFSFRPFRYLESAGGHRWLAQRIPDRAVFASANQARFQVANQKERRNVLHSPGLVEWAEASGLWNVTTDGPLNW